MTVVMMRRGDVETFVGKFLESWRVRAWERECEEAGSSVSLGSSIRSASGTGGFDSSGMRVVGVARIIRREQEIWESTDKSLQQQHSLTELESKAQEMVMLADKMKLKLLSGSSQNKPANDEEMGSKEEMQDWFLRIGIISPVTRESAGALYHQQLAPVLRKFDSGVMAIQSEAHRDEEVFAGIKALVTTPDAFRMGISASDAAMTLASPQHWPRNIS